MNPQTEDITHCTFRQLADSGELSATALTRFLRSDLQFIDQLLGLTVSDPAHPYGRRVLLDTPSLEVMVAKWNRDMPCAPHDHGGSVGAVRVLQGKAIHTVWKLQDGELRPVLVDEVEAGEVLSCGPDMIHSMGDAGADEPLVTLHMYTAGIDHMVVYDTEREQTLVVEGNCGAWVPRDDPAQIRSTHMGYCAPDTVR